MSFPYISDIFNAIFGTQWSIPIPMFGLIVVGAIVAAAFVAKRVVEGQEKTGRQPPGTAAVVADMSLVSALAAIAGARLFYIFDHLDDFFASPLALIFTRSGFSIYGGFTIGVLTGIWYIRRRKLPITPMLDAVGPAIMLGYAIGRLGCQVAGDGDWGITANPALQPGWLPDWLWAQTYDGNILGQTIPPPGVYPTPLYESVAAFILFAILYSLRAHRQRPGFLFSLWLLFAGFERIWIEKIRINIEHDFFGVSLTQAELISIPVIVAGLIGVLLTLTTRTRWIRVLIAGGVLAALVVSIP